jgi:hypothetical protein
LTGYCGLGKGVLWIWIGLDIHPVPSLVDVRYSKAMETDVQQSDDIKRVDATLGHLLLMLKDKLKWTRRAQKV